MSTIPLVLLNQIVAVSEQLKATRSRTAKVTAVAGLLEARSTHELRTIIAWMSGELLQGRIGISAGRAHAFSKGVVPANTPSLTIADVDRAFIAVQNMTGPGSLAAREQMIEDLLTKATETEQQFLVGLLSGELRQGALAGLVIEGIARAGDLSSALVRRAAMLSGDLPTVACVALSEGTGGLEKIGLQLFVPVLPMLAQTVGTTSEALQRKSPLAFEEKLDGMRLQLHRHGERVELYSRTLRRLTPSLPEVVEYARALTVDRLILDGEIMRFGPDGSPAGFGAAMERFGRKSDAPEVEPGQHPEVTPVFFDCLMADGASLIDSPTEVRWAALVAITNPTNRVRRLVTANAEEASKFLEDVLDRGHEGVVAKSVDSAYTAGGRGAHWFKIKPAHTMDVVILAAEWGQGRRKGRLSNLHLGSGTKRPEPSSCSVRPSKV